jgi:adenylate cyclase
MKPLKYRHWQATCGIMKAFCGSEGLAAAPAQENIQDGAVTDQMSSGNILLVDDSPSIRLMLEDQLTASGYGVYAAENGKRALELLCEVTPDLVITDVSMPEMDGFDLCRSLRESAQFRDVPIIILTAATEEKDACEGLGLGVADYIRKPFSARELILRVQNILTGAREKRRIREIFARHSSPEVVAELLSQTEELMLSGETREIAVLFADIRGFTPLASGTPPVDLVILLNRYLTVMSEAVIAQGGTLDKFLGDGIMAIFGAPLKHEDDALRSARAAIGIQKGVRKINQEREARGLGALQVGIGITLGPAVVGNIGSPMRTDYTAIGDCVNVAFRLQSIASGGQIILSETALRKIGPALNAKALDPVIVKGKTGPINIYSLLY